MRQIKFGTDGWRGVIADDYTFRRVAVVSAAVGEYLQAEKSGERTVAIGYDNRFVSEDFAALVATVLTRMGIRVRLSEHSIPTPLVSFAIKHHGLDGGVMITASHNPARYNGVKFKPWYAGSASEESTRDIEQRANRLLNELDVDAIRAQGADDALLTRESFVPSYLEHVLHFVDIERIRAVRPRLLCDPLYGSSIGVLDVALRQAGCEVSCIHAERNPWFGGLNPEPVPEQLDDLRAAVRQGHYDGAIASDGDGDRIAAMTGDGEYVSPHHLLALLLIHLVEDRGLRGGVVKTVSTTTMINQLAERYNLPLYETPIGFKYIAQLMMEQDILIGGEESGGIGIRGHLPERDATLAALLLVDMMACHQTDLRGLLDLLRDRVGEHYYHRVDVHLARPASREQMAQVRQAVPTNLDGVALRDVSERDGIKLFFSDGSWLLLRASGTEPVLRVYAEADNPNKVDTLLREGRDIITDLAA